MKKTVFLVMVLLGFGITASADDSQSPQTPPPASADGKPAAETPDFVLSRMEICKDVSNRKPVSITAKFPASQDQVYCFLEFGGAKKETTVSVVWTLGRQEMARTSLPVRRFPMYRTWANKAIAGMKGDWKVDVVDEKGVVIKTASFTVE